MERLGAFLGTHFVSFLLGSCSLMLFGHQPQTVCTQCPWQKRLRNLREAFCWRLVFQAAKGKARSYKDQSRCLYAVCTHWLCCSFRYRIPLFLMLALQLCRFLCLQAALHFLQRLSLWDRFRQFMSICLAHEKDHQALRSQSHTWVAHHNLTD